MSKFAKIIVTIILVIAYLLFLSFVGNSGAEVGSPLAYLSIALFLGLLFALRAIWKKKE